MISHDRQDTRSLRFVGLIAALAVLATSLTRLAPLVRAYNIVLALERRGRYSSMR